MNLSDAHVGNAGAGDVCRMDSIAEIGGLGSAREKGMKSELSGLLRFALTCTIFAMFSAGCAKNDASSQAEKQSVAKRIAVPSVEETEAIAEEGFIFGLPIVMNYADMYQFNVDKSSLQFKVPFNVIFNEAHISTYKDTAVLTPNNDTPNSMVMMDLRAEPFVLSVPAVPKSRYYAVMLCDGNTFNFGYIGTRATGTEPGDYLVVGPDWKGETPAKIKKVFYSTTQFAMAVFRTQLFNASDLPNVIKLQSGYKGRPLSAYLKQPAPAAAPPIDFLKVDGDWVKKSFFDYLGFALQFNPATPDEKDIRAKLASIGIGPGKKFEMKALSLQHKAAILLGMKEGSEKVDKYIASGRKDVNGWQVSSFFGDRGFYRGDWLKRAAAAKAGIYGDDAIEAMYPQTSATAAGETLDASRHNYTLTFPTGQFPPANAFWSVTMYDGKTQFLVKNPINRYLISSRMLPSLQRNPDGSLTLYLQKDAPDAAIESNWLPAPDGPVRLVMRLYWPTLSLPSILPAGQGTWKPPGIIQSM
jgi:hypothetical protein